MRINNQQTIAKFLFPRKIIIVPFVVMAFLFVSSSISFAPTKLSAKNPDKLRSYDVMNDQELSDVNAQSFFQLTQYSNTRGSQNVIRLNLGVNMVTNAHIESLKMGYYDNGSHTGWDIDVVNYFWGGNDYSAGVPSSSLVWNGIYLELGFDNISNNSTRALNYLDFGTEHATGQVTGTINMVNLLAAGGTGTNNGVSFRQTASGTRILNFTDDPLSFVFAVKYTYSGSTNLRGIFQRTPNYHTSDDLSRP
jgi:hypothetical protein